MKMAKRHFVKRELAAAPRAIRRSTFVIKRWSCKDRAFRVML